MRFSKILLMVLVSFAAGYVWCLFSLAMMGKIR